MVRWWLGWCNFSLTSIRVSEVTTNQTKLIGCDTIVKLPSLKVLNNFAHKIHLLEEVPPVFAIMLLQSEVKSSPNYFCPVSKTIKAKLYNHYLLRDLFGCFSYWDSANYTLIKEFYWINIFVAENFQQTHLSSESTSNEFYMLKCRYYKGRQIWLWLNGQFIL